MLKLIYHIRAKFPIKANIPVNKVYPYCNPEKVALSDPQEIIVKLEGRESGVGSWELGVE